MNASQLIDALTKYEVSAAEAVDRRTISTERQALSVAVGRVSDLTAKVRRLEETEAGMIKMGNGPSGSLTSARRDLAAAQERLEAVFGEAKRVAAMYGVR